MAAKKTNDTHQNGNQTDQSSSSDGGFEDFISAQLQQQEKESKQKDNIDTAKRDSFIARAKAESKRMNREIEKSKAKREKLHEELGEARLAAWRNEHAAEALTPEQAALIDKTYQQT